MKVDLKRLRSYVPAIGIFCLALSVRVVYNLTVARHYTPQHDSLFYYMLGVHILSEHCFCVQPFIPTAYRAPLWPAIIAGIITFFGQHAEYPRYFLCLVGSGTCVLVYYFGRDLFGWRTGLVAGAAAAIYPELYIYDGWLYTESLYIFLFFGFCYAVYRLQRDQKRANWIWCGVLLGLLSLTRPNGLLVLVLFLFWVAILVWRKLLPWRFFAKGAAVITLITAIFVIPWTIRNYNVTHTLVPVATGDGTVLLGAYNTSSVYLPSYPGGFPGSWINPLVSSPAIADKYPDFCVPACEVARDTYFRAQAIHWIENNLRLMPHLLKLHFINMWRPATYESDLPVDTFFYFRSSKLVLKMMETFPIAVFILAGLGLTLTLHRWRELLFLYLMILLTIAQCVIFYGIPRFRAPIEPILILLGSGVIWWITSRDYGTLRWLFENVRKKTTEKVEAETEDVAPASTEAVGKQ
jgi:4-amino-4-deoxy-L-arabinose transferase-like glycosyltransferase